MREANCREVQPEHESSIAFRHGGNGQAGDAAQQVGVCGRWRRR